MLCQAANGTRCKNIALYDSIVKIHATGSEHDNRRPDCWSQYGQQSLKSWTNRCWRYYHTCKPCMQRMDLPNYKKTHWTHLKLEVGQFRNWNHHNVAGLNTLFGVQPTLTTGKESKSSHFAITGIPIRINITRYSNSIIIRVKHSENRMACEKGYVSARTQNGVSFVIASMRFMQN